MDELCSGPCVALKRSSGEVDTNRHSAPRTGDTIEPTIPAEREGDKRERNAPLPNEETYEREPAGDRELG
jgi:hypothetical protein